jgi:hypothetical protein
MVIEDMFASSQSRAVVKGADDRDRDECGHGAVDADQGGQCRAQDHQRGQHGEAVPTDATEELLPGPCGDTGGVERLAHHVQRGEVDDHRVAEPGNRLGRRDRAGDEQRECDRQCDDGRRHLVRHEGDDRQDEDHEGS